MWCHIENGRECSAINESNLASALHTLSDTGVNVAGGGLIFCDELDERSAGGLFNTL